MSDIKLGNLYEINKAIMSKQPVLSRQEVTNGLSDIAAFFTTDYNLTVESIENGWDKEINWNFPKYYMLLCNEMRDYTLFKLGAQHDSTIRDVIAEQAIEDLRECFTNRNLDILSIEVKDNEQCVEIWVRGNENYQPLFSDEQTSGTYCYYLFPYDNGVLEYD
jgi:hypothetical protein